LRKGQFTDISGQRFGMLTAISIDHLSVQRNGCARALWKCRCDCGNETVASISNLRNGHTRSCGCLVVESASKTHFKHGDKGKDKVDRLYPVWRSMKQRCQLPSMTHYKDYGGRGITVCKEWQDYIQFKRWAIKNGYDENAPRGKCTIDRIDVNGNYEPSNCRWVDMKIQAHNKRNSI
jgi:hypothetical protein